MTDISLFSSETHSKKGPSRDGSLFFFGRKVQRYNIHHLVHLMRMKDNAT